MSPVDGLGYLASGLVLGTFCMRGMLRLRGLAIASNVAFIAYGWTAGIEPVLILHAVLLPMNALRLLEVLGCGLAPLRLVERTRRWGPIVATRRLAADR